MNKIITFLIAFSLLTGVVLVSNAEAVSSTTSTVNNSFIFTSTLRSGMSGSIEIVKLQQYLIDRGYLAGYADGKFGRMTHAGVIRFQSANGLKPDGIVGRGTRAVLNADVIPNNNTLTVLSPNGGENWITNSIRTISWSVNNANLSTKVDLYLYANTDSCVYPCIAGIPSVILDRNISANSTYNWIVGTDIVNNPIPPGEYRLGICLTGTSTCDSSNGVFTISNGNNPQPSVTVLSPNSGEYWGINSTQTISWKLNNTSSDTKVDIYLEVQPYNCGVVGPCPMISMLAPYVLDRNISNFAPYNWIVGTDINNAKINPGTYNVRICLSGTSTCDSSDSPLTLLQVVY